ncbi:MAG: type VI secretion system contractile sheath large subunit [Deltaproteobacteria bacterium]|nr:MAG: type VI secretion system contractile sheath large subunit [Deltaproteobacteria bacterium]
MLKSVLPPDNLPAKPTELLAPPANGSAPAPTTPPTPAEAKTARERERVQHFLQLLGLLLVNLDYAKRDQGDGNGEPDPNRQVYFVDKKTFADLLARVNELIALQLNEVFHQPALRDLEGKWRAISDLVDRTNFAANIGISLLDAAKDEIGEDMSTNGADIAASDLFKKVYTAEYDQLGGEPYAALIGLYQFENNYNDRVFLKGMATLCKHSHAPFVAAAASSVFGLEDMSRLMEVRDFSAALDEAWLALREQEEFAYIGLTLPRYIARRPYKATDSAGGVVRFKEEPPSPEQEAQRYVWASSAMLFARNLVRSFEGSGWCQYIRGVKSGGYLENLARIALEGADDEIRPPLEVIIPDYGELALADAGFIPLVHKKGSTDAVFFSSQAIKRPSNGTDPHISENSQLTCNLAYTFSISRLAHYLKRMMRDNVGSSADANYVKSQIDAWISRYVTTIVNPDDLTLRYYPFKAYTLSVVPVDGRAGWYDCNLTVQPHIQFEGMDVTLRVDARLASDHK